MSNTVQSVVLATYFLAVPVNAQSVNDLIDLSDAVWAVSASHSDGMQVFNDVVEKFFPSAIIKDNSLGTFHSDWTNVAQDYSAHFPDFSHLDSISCTVLKKEGITRLESAIAQYGKDVRHHIPQQLRQFDLLLSTFSEEVKEGVASLQFCTGAFHPGQDRVDFKAWDQWYDHLEFLLKDAGMEIDRQSSSSDAYIAGFLSAKGNVCYDNSCVVLATPFSVAIPSANTSQTTFSIVSIIRL